MNRVLLGLVNEALAEAEAKRSFVAASPQINPAAIGAPPGGGQAPPGMDPAAAGGGQPPMDPAMAGGAPPVDPAAAQAQAAPPQQQQQPGIDPGMIRQIIREEMMASQGGGAGAQQPQKPKGAGKPDPAEIVHKVDRLEKIVLSIGSQLGATFSGDEVSGMLDAGKSQEQGQSQGQGGSPGGTSPSPAKAASVGEQASAMQILLATMADLPRAA